MKWRRARKQDRRIAEAVAALHHIGSYFADLRNEEMSRYAHDAARRLAAPVQPEEKP